MPNERLGQDALYEEAVTAHGDALHRLARSYEADSERRRDLVQEIHLALWRSFEGFDSRCSLRTWVYRVAHNVAASHVIRDHRFYSRTLLGLDALETLPAGGDQERAAGQHEALERL